MRSENELLYAHGSRVARLACAIARKMGYSGKGLEHIHFAAIFHDIGKMKIPKEIVNKCGPLDDQEFSIVKKHPELGYHLLKKISPESVAAEVALQHHERMDGSGYPFGLRGDNIIPIARIISVADVIDAMVSAQVYRPALSVEEALRELGKNCGQLYDPKVVAVSVTLIKKGEGCV